MIRNVLFIGNSFTARNDVPGLIATMAASRGGSLEHRLFAAGGASLRGHWNAGEAQRAIAGDRYDFVVLQEQSTLPVKNARRMHENIRLFDAVIGASGAKTALYLTWARENAPDAQAAIADAYLSIGKELGAVVAPVGLAWQRCLRTHASLVLHDRDKSHPTFAGSYLAACVLFSVLFGESCVGLGGSTGGLARSDVDVLQRIAWETVSA